MSKILLSSICCCACLLNIDLTQSFSSPSISAISTIHTANIIGSSSSSSSIGTPSRLLVLLEGHRAFSDFNRKARHGDSLRRSGGRYYNRNILRLDSTAVVSPTAEPSPPELLVLEDHLESGSTTILDKQGSNLDIVDSYPLLGSNELSPVRLKNGQIMGKYAYRLGLPMELTTSLESFLKVSGIDDMFRVLLTQTPLDPDESILVSNEINGQDCVWNVQRPRAHWRNNMHWIAPAGEGAQQQLLDALYHGGSFDRILEAIGKEFGMKKEDIVIHHAFFIGVSCASNSYTHQDFANTDGRGFTMLIPIRLVQGKNGEELPELGFQNDERTVYGWYKYRKGEAALVGDGTWHVTADCDYSDAKDYRICANVYICHKNHPINSATNSKGVYTKKN